MTFTRFEPRGILSAPHQRKQSPDGISFCALADIAPAHPSTRAFRCRLDASLLPTEPNTPDAAPDVPFAGCSPALPELQAQDRKSTRLNSSHRCISYAVFCL